uniref:Variant surface glycoprotein 1213 n=1 Tax=Trypanosoma brucei TaxID=5691 RepID=M4SXY1_9TRYP|nr:variant surface glycoprotein 1213 [Trypanosoma brucei]
MMRRMHPATIGLVAVLTQLLIYKTNAAEGDDSENQAELNALRRLIRAAQAGFEPKTRSISKHASAAFASIQHACLLAGANDAKIAEALAAEISEPNKRPKLLPHTEAGYAAKQRINETHNVALQIKEAAEGIATKKAEDITAANKLLAQVLTGDETGQKDDGDEGNYFKAEADEKVFGAAPTVAKNCGGTGACGNNGGNTGVSLLSDFACLCLVGPNAGHKKLCAGTMTTVDDNGTPHNNPKASFQTAYSAMIKKCHKQQVKVTPQYLIVALTNFQNLIGAQARRANSNHGDATDILGYARAGKAGCTGGDSQACVNYKVQLGSDTATGIPWSNNLQLAIQKATATDPLPKLEAAEADMQQLNTTIWKLYGSGFRVESGRQIESTTQQPVDQEKFEECKMHKPKKECEENNCKWDGKTETDGECEPKPGTETPETAAGTVEGAACTTTKKIQWEIRN